MQQNLIQPIPFNQDLADQLETARKDLERSYKQIVVFTACCIGWTVGCAVVGVRWHFKNR